MKNIPDPLKMQSAYPLAEAARILETNPSTLRTWFRGRSYPTSNGRKHAPPVIKATQEVGSPLSFIDLVEAHMLLAIRRGYGIPLKRLRKAMDYLKGSGGDLLFLAHSSFRHDRQHLYVKKDECLVSLSEDGQHVEPEIICEGIKQLMYGEDGYANRFYPPRNKREQKAIFLDPSVSFGRPTLADIHVSVDAVVARFAAGEHIQDLAEDYGTTPEQIENAIRWTNPQHAIA
jgi:uncharacterized protein (DUF433 family)